jgi:Holliday junction resolvase
VDGTGANSKRTVKQQDVPGKACRYLMSLEIKSSAERADVVVNRQQFTYLNAFTRRSGRLKIIASRDALTI